MAKSVARGKALVAALRARPDTRDPEALAVWCGRHKNRSKARALGAVVAAKARAGAKKSSPPALPVRKDPDAGGFGRSFPDSDAANDAMQKEFAPWRKGLSKARRDALEDYKDSAYVPINRKLRGLAWKEHDGERRTGGGIDGQIAAMDSAFDKNARLKAPTTVYRGRPPDAVMEAFERGDPAKLKGMQVADAGFLSTSMNPATARRFEPTHVAKIRLPKGAKAVYLNGLADFGETEVLLPRGSRFKITDAYKLPDGTNMVDMELVA